MIVQRAYQIVSGADDSVLLAIFHDKVIRIGDLFSGERLSHPRPGRPKTPTQPRPPVPVQLPGTSEETGLTGAVCQSAPGSVELPLNQPGPGAYCISQEQEPLAGGLAYKARESDPKGSCRVSAQVFSPW